MKLLLVVAASCLWIASAQDCRSPQSSKVAFGTYLQCIKNTLDKDYGKYEREIREHNRRAAAACFSPTIAEANSRERCVLAISDLDSKAWDRNGPLRDCSICRTFAAGAIKALLSTPPEEQKCIRNEVALAVAREADYCLRKKISDFPGVPDIPDLEEGSYAYKEDVINSVSDYILIHSRLAFCAERKPARAAATKKCLENPFVGYLSEHCTAIRSCDRQVTPSCTAQIKNVKSATCACIEETREELKRRIAGIAEGVKSAVAGGGRSIPAIGSGSKVDVCVSNIKSQMISPVNDWVSVIDTALNNCIKNKPAGQSLGMDSLLNVGCRKVIADTTGTATTQLKTAFEFINNLIDAMVDRSGRFCANAHCLE